MDVRDRRLCRSLLNKGTVPLERKKQNPPFVCYKGEAPLGLLPVLGFTACLIFLLIGLILGKCYKGEAPLGLLPVFGFVSLPYFSVDWFDPGEVLQR